MQERIDETRNFGRHGRGEKQGLSGKGDKFADTFDVGNKAHIEHAVGLVDDENLDAGQKQFAAIGKIKKPARRCDQYVGAAGDLGLLIAEGHASNQQGHIEFVIDAVPREAFFDLRCKFARRLKDQRAWHAGAGTALFQTA
jgi:hypothetical protein